MSRESDYKKVNINLITLVMSALIAIGGGFASYYNALSDIKKEIAASIEKSRLEAQMTYVTKAEFNLIKDMISRIDMNIETTRQEITDLNKRFMK